MRIKYLKKIIDGCLSFCPIFFLAIVLSVLLRFTDFEYRFDIFNLFLYNNNDSFNENTIKCISYVMKSINCDGFRFYLSNKKDDMERNHPLVKSTLFPNNKSLLFYNKVRYSIQYCSVFRFLLF
jgi:hypothetical protein